MNSEWCGVLNGPREMLEQVWLHIERQTDVTGCGKLVSSAGAVMQPGLPLCAVEEGNLEPYDGDQLFLSGVESDGGFREWLRKLPGEWPGITGEFEAYHDSDLKSSYTVWRIDADGTVYAMRRVRGYYRTAEQDDPVLAYELGFACNGSQDDLIAQLRRDGVFIGTTDPSGTPTGDEDSTDPSNTWSCRAWTVDEELYLDALQTFADGHRTDNPGLIDHVRELYDAVCRDIEQTPDEIKVSNDRCAADKGPDNRGERAVRAAGI